MSLPDPSSHWDPLYQRVAPSREVYSTTPTVMAPVNLMPGSVLVRVTVLPSTVSPTELSQ